MNLEIRRLTPDLAEDYVRFFDTTPHDQHVDEHKCYCVCWSSDDAEGKDFSTVEKRRALALQYARNGNIQGYLAYHDGNIVGWCNANTKADCLKSISWRMFMDYVPVEAYPYKEAGFQSSDFGGHDAMYTKNGFEIAIRTDKGLVMRKALR